MDSLRGRPPGKKNYYPSDLQMIRLYEAQESLPGSDVLDFTSKEEVRAYIRSVLRARWFKRRYPDVKKVRIKLPGNRNHLATAERFGPFGHLYLPTWAWNKLYIAHELAHICTPPLDKTETEPGRAIHSREFVGTQLYLTKRLCGEEVCAILKKELLKHNVDWDSRYAS
jgi:putative metallohydrolase (TIGR04338 family)